MMNIKAIARLIDANDGVDLVVSEALAAAGRMVASDLVFVAAL
jgi:hypothetical protein